MLISGATGGVGVFAVQLSAATGATVLGTARPDFADSLRGLGTAHTVDYTGDLATAVNHAASDGVTAVVTRPAIRPNSVSFCAPVDGSPRWSAPPSSRWDATM